MPRYRKIRDSVSGTVYGATQEEVMYPRYDEAMTAQDYEAKDLREQRQKKRKPQTATGWRRG